MKKLSLLIFILLCGVISITAQEPVHYWSLEDCIYRAQTKNLDYKQALLSGRSAEISKTEAIHRRFPSLDLNGSYGYNFGRTVDPTSNEFIATNLGFNSVGASTNLPLFAGGRINNAIKQADYNLAAATANEDNILRQIVLTIANTYLSILMAEEQVKNAEHQVNLSNEQIKRVDDLIESGAEARNARLDFLAQISRDEENLIMAINNLDATKLDLMQALLLDIPIDEFKLAIPEVDDTDWAKQPIPELAELLPRAIKIDPRIKADSMTVIANQYGIKIARGGFYPMLSLSGSLSSNYSTQGRILTGYETIDQRLDMEINGQPVTVTMPTEIPVFNEKPNFFEQLNSNFGYGFVVGLSIPILNNYQTRASVEQAKVNYLQAENELERTHWRIKSEIQQIILNAKASQRSYVAQQNTYEALKNAYHNAVTRYEIGAINNYDLLKAQSDFNQAEQNLTAAKYDLIFKLKVIDFYQGKLLIID